MEIARQNEVVISLLGRIAFPDGKVRELVTKDKRNPEKYVQGYNACNGFRTLSDIVAIIGVKHPTLSPILKQWEDLGIVYEVEKTGGKFYRRLFPI